jgi:GTP-binding protein
MSEAEWTGVTFYVVDTGGIDPSQVGAGKGQRPLSVGSADFITEIRSQAEIAIREADAVLFITDADSGVTPADQEVRRSCGATRSRWTASRLCCWWSIRATARRRLQALQFYGVGLGGRILSALHGRDRGPAGRLVAVLKLNKARRKKTLGPVRDRQRV